MSTVIIFGLFSIFMGIQFDSAMVALILFVAYMILTSDYILKGGYHV